MDPHLRALCQGVIDGDVASQEFAALIIETGINLESPEWEVANRLLEQQEIMNSFAKRLGNTVQ